MELYNQVAYDTSRHLTLQYSSSFGIGSRFFGAQVKPHIYAIYGLVRIADEIVDTYRGPGAGKLLDNFEQETYAAIESGFSTNMAVHAFALTARRYGIGRDLIQPFFASMRVDLSPQTYSDQAYKAYIYGSAEVVGLMCLRVFIDGDEARYAQLAPGAAALGSAYQKVNFLRDLAADYAELGRLYFPDITFESFNESDKAEIIRDIHADFTQALPALRQLPPSSRRATAISYAYYSELLRKLERTPVDVIKTTRVRLPTPHKLGLLAKTVLQPGPLR